MNRVCVNSLSPNDLPPRGGLVLTLAGADSSRRWGLQIGGGFPVDHCFYIYLWQAGTSHNQVKIIQEFSEPANR